MANWKRNLRDGCLTILVQTLVFAIVANGVTAIFNEFNIFLLIST